MIHQHISHILVVPRCREITRIIEAGVATNSRRSGVTTLMYMAMYIAERRLDPPFWAETKCRHKIPCELVYQNEVEETILTLFRGNEVEMIARGSVAIFIVPVQRDAIVTRGMVEQIMDGLTSTPLRPRELRVDYNNDPSVFNHGL